MIKKFLGSMKTRAILASTILVGSAPTIAHAQKIGEVASDIDTQLKNFGSLAQTFFMVAGIFGAGFGIKQLVEASKGNSQTTYGQAGWKIAAGVGSFSLGAVMAVLRETTQIDDNEDLSIN